MPWPISPDRLSPSGPFLPLGGGILKIGGDCVLERQEVPDGELVAINSVVTPTPVPIQVPIPDYTPGNALWLQTTLVWAWEPGEDSTAFVQVIPVIQVGGADAFVPDNTVFAWTPDGSGASGMGDIIGTTTAQALFIPEPQDLITGGINVGLLIALNGMGTFTLFGNFAEGVPNNDPGRCYLTVAEIDPRGLIGACPATLKILP